MSKRLGGIKGCKSKDTWYRILLLILLRGSAVLIFVIFVMIVDMDGVEAMAADC